MSNILSIITVCYNEKQIEKTCKSIINQTWWDFEWIVIDGGSTDGTLDLLKKYQDRIDVLISEPDKGIYNAMNKGIKLAKGKYLNFMNGGDAFYNNTVLEEVFKDKSYQADVLYGRCCASNSTISIFKDYPSQLKMIFFHFQCIQHQSSFIKRELFKKYGLYNEKYKIVSDYEKWLVFFKNNCSFQYIPNLIAQYDMSGISSTNLQKHVCEHHKAHASILQHIKQYDISLFKYFHFTKKIIFKSF